MALAVVLVVAACGTSSPVATVPSPSPAPSQTTIQSPSPALVSIVVANAEIRARVSGANPVLLPAAVPAGWSARLTELGSWFFTVIYSSPDGKQTIEFAIVVPNPPPPGPNGLQVQPGFHGDRHSLYQVDDKAQAGSHRWLIWNEPGTWSEPNGLPGVPYFLSTTGLTDAEFWAVANSVK